MSDGRPEVDVGRQQQQVVEEGARRGAVEQRRRGEGAEDPGPEGEQVEDRHHQREGDHAGEDEVADRVDPEHREGVELLADLARAELGGDRRAERPRDDRRRQHRPELAQEGDRGDRRDPVDRAEGRGERSPLDPDRREADHERDHRRRPERDAQREDELADELPSPGEARADQLGPDPQRQRRHSAGVQQPELRRDVGATECLAGGRDRTGCARSSSELDPRCFHPQPLGGEASEATAGLRRFRRRR